MNTETKKIKLLKVDQNAKTPNYAHRFDAGMDLFSNENNYILKTGERKGFLTGIKMEIPEGYAGLIWDKSGLALRNGIKTIGGVIDSTYRGEVAVILLNTGNEEYLVERGSKIGQIIFQKIEYFEITIEDSLNDTSRGEGGFGSTGLM